MYSVALNENVTDYSLEPSRKRVGYGGIDGLEGKIKSVNIKNFKKY
ncbi:hypothetical protein [Calorimonas adulescens]|nr:hypothetical protein [Calorimonas adulescens]